MSVTPLVQHPVVTICTNSCTITKHSHEVFTFSMDLT